MTIKLGALIVKGKVARPRPQNDYAQTLRFFEGLGKDLSTWEIDLLIRAEGGKGK